MVKHIHAKPGHKFVLTQIGFEIGNVRAKYDDSYPNRQYHTCVPESWLTKGYVCEVKVGD